MARGVNKVILIGTAGKDPETRYMPSGAAVTNISIATNESWKDKQTGEQKERTEWHNLVFFGRLAEVVAAYVRKGSQIYVEGSLTTEKWQDKNGNDRYTTKVKCNEMQMLGGKPDGQRPAQQRPAQEPRPSAPAVNEDGFDDDIPF